MFLKRFNVDKRLRGLTPQYMHLLSRVSLVTVVWTLNPETRYIKELVFLVFLQQKRRHLGRKYHQQNRQHIHRSDSVLFTQP